MSIDARDPRIIVALDFPEPAAALALAGRLAPDRCAVKVGKELFVAGGPEVVRTLVGRGFRVFLDLKFHDIPNTVAGACAAATRLRVWMFTVHASGGKAMLDAARRAADEASTPGHRPLIVAVTVLTSLDDIALRSVGVDAPAATQVMRLARLAVASRLDGVVCSAAEAPALRAALGDQVRLVTPGIRPAGSAADDQARIVTPAAALANGADHLVIGRPITHAPDPRAAFDAIQRSLGVAA